MTLTCRTVLSIAQMYNSIIAKAIAKTIIRGTEPVASKSFAVTVQVSAVQEPIAILTLPVAKIKAAPVATQPITTASFIMDFQVIAVLNFPPVRT